MHQRQVPIIPSSRASIADLISPDNGYRGKISRLGAKPKDHIKQNIREMRELESRRREEKEISSQSPRDLYKLPQFRDAASRVFNDENILTSNTSRTNTNFLEKGMSERRREELAAKRRQERIELESRMEELRLAEDKPSTPRKPSIPKAHEHGTLLPRSNSDFIRKNRIEAIVSHPKTEAEEVVESKHEEYGHVPRYLEERKAQWEHEAEERRRKEPDPNCPPGMKLMPESERIETLEILERNKQEAMNQMQKLPFVIETPSMIRKKNDLEMKLKEIESAIRLFSRPKVYVKL
jgi:hypothetical protein